MTSSPTKLTKVRLGRSITRGLIKLADLIGNSLSIIEYDKSFAKVYMREKSELLTVLTDGDKQLFDEAQKIVNDWNNSQS